jgi:hypothetical protein
MLNIPPDVERDAIFVKVYLQTGDGLDACKRAGFIINGYDDRTVRNICWTAAIFKKPLRSQKSPRLGSQRL